MTIVPIDDHRPDTPVVQSRRAGPGEVLGYVDDFWRLAERISNTEFVPGALRRRPEAVLAALLSGAERGLGPMESLRSIHIIDGRPGLSAEAMRALVLAQGHDVEIIENSDRKASMMGRRLGHEQWSVPFSYTIDQARRAGLANKDNWRKYPEDMLLARATSRMCKAIFADVTAGLAVTEELADEVEDTAVSTTRREPPRRRPPRAAAAAVGPLQPSPTSPGTTDTASPVAGVQGATATAVEDVSGIPGADQPSWLGGETRPHDPTLARRLHAEIAQAFPDAAPADRDRYRHALVACVTRRRTDGPIASSTELTYAEQLDLSTRLADIAAGRTTVGDGPDDTVEVRPRGWIYTVTLDPLTVTGGRSGEPAESDIGGGDSTTDEATDQPTLDEEDTT